MAKIKKAEMLPSLNKNHKLKRQNWAKIGKTDEMRVTLGGPDRWARGWITNRHRASLRVRLLWVAIVS